MKITLRIIGAFGALLFGSFLYFTYSTPGYVEEAGKDYIKSQVEKKINAQIDSITLKSGNGALSKIAKKLYEKNQERIESIKLQLKNNAHEKMASVIAEMRDLDCECRAKWAAHIEQQFHINITTLEATNQKLMDFMRIKYMEVAVELKRDVRIFAGSNTLIFLLLLLVSFFKPQAVTHLFLPGLLLVCSTIVCSYFYIFEQNWLFTIIYNDYLGYSYLTYIGVLFLFLCDIVFNRARVTTEIINAALEVIGQAASVAPC